MSEIPTIQTITVTVDRNLRRWPLTRPVTNYLAERLKTMAAQLDALNASRKTQLDAASALRIEVQTLRNYVDILGLSWANISRRPRKPNLLPKN